MNVTGKFVTNHEHRSKRFGRRCGEQRAAVSTRPNGWELRPLLTRCGAVFKTPRWAPTPLRLVWQRSFPLQRASVRSQIKAGGQRYGAFMWGGGSDPNVPMKGAGETLALPYHLNTALTGLSAIILPAIFLDKLLHL